VDPEFLENVIENRKYVEWALEMQWLIEDYGMLNGINSVHHLLETLVNLDSDAAALLDKVIIQ
jgi:hypothetical protein